MDQQMFKILQEIGVFSLVLGRRNGGNRLRPIPIAHVAPVTQVRDVYEHVRASREKFLAAHPGLSSRMPAAAVPPPKPLRPADTAVARSLSRRLSSRGSFRRAAPELFCSASAWICCL